MSTVGIIAEYNPFHTGHAYQIAKSRAVLGKETTVIVVMSGNWVQQADCAIVDKWTRARLALLGGADLVLELPTLWATSSAETFARGAVFLLHASGVVGHLSFGSEEGNVDHLAAVAACLDSGEYRAALTRYLDEGISFPKARQNAVEEQLGEKAKVLSNPNNNLGVEYIRALNALDSPIQPMTILRLGAAHNSVFSLERSVVHGCCQQFVSATQLRMDLLKSDWDRVEPYLLPEGRELLKSNMISLPQLQYVSRAMLAKLRTMTAEDWAALPDSGEAEGLPQRLEQAGRRCTSVGEFLDLVKTRRYTHARLRRLMLWAYLGVTRADWLKQPPYLRVLGFNDRGREQLKAMKDRAAIPILTKPAHACKLGEEGRRLFALEARCTDLYDLCFESIPAPGREWTCGPVVLK